MKAVGDWLGHAIPNITLSTYAHLMPADANAAPDLIDDEPESTEVLGDSAYGSGEFRDYRLPHASTGEVDGKAHAFFEGPGTKNA